MLNFGNKEFRNLQEQVLKNAQDIETLKGRENLQIVIVEELPETGNPNYIYLVPNEEGEESNVYNEYIWLADEEAYEQIGAVNIDLTNYVTTDTEQTLTADKTTIANFILYSESSTISPELRLQNNTSTIRIRSNGFVTEINSNWCPRSNNSYRLGNSNSRWKELYINSFIDFDGATIGMDAALLKIKYGNNTALGISVNAIYANFSMGTLKIYPQTTNNYDLGDSTHYWNNFYLVGYISDGANAVSVANIASKVTSTFISGTFDANGESTIDTEQAGTPEGLFIFTYGNCQCFLRLTATMVQNADTTPIRVSIPMIYNSATTLGWLNITKSGDILILKVTDGTNHVDSGYSWTLTKTNLL